MPVGPLRCFARMTSAILLVGLLAGVVLVAVDEEDRSESCSSDPLSRRSEGGRLSWRCSTARETVTSRGSDVELACEHLSARDLRNLLDTVFRVRTRRHELEVVDDDEAQVGFLDLSRRAFERSSMIVVEPESST